MTRYDIQGNIENEHEPGGRVLKNKLGVRLKREIDRLEYEHLLKTQKHYYRVIKPTTQFTNHLICEMHHYWLGSIYAWAGKYRTVNLGKMGFLWPPATLVERNMAEFEKTSLKKFTPCNQASLDGVSNSIAMVHAEFLLVHPFREGNGRLARLISSLMALQAGYPAPDFGFSQSKNRQQYLTAVKKGYLQNYELLTSFVKEAIERSKRLSVS